MIDVAAEVFRQEPSACLLLVGDGPEEGVIRERAHRAGIAHRIPFAGAREDVPRLLKAAVDLLLLPSWHEGLGVAVVEAQAAGVPCIVADHLPSDIDVAPVLVKRIPSSAGASEWGAAALCAARQPPIDATKPILNGDGPIWGDVGR